MSPSCLEATDFEQVIVNKPWGYEYLMFGDDAIGVWCLHINPGERTSLHCHPLKKTGLILLSGEAEISFLNDSVRLRAPDKIMLRAGLFHSTCALSPDGAIVIEVETPRHKTNLVRLEDKYGRRQAPYEGAEAKRKRTEDCIRLTLPENGEVNTYRVRDCTLRVEQTDDVESLAERATDEIILVMRGGLYSGDGQPVLAEGDVITPPTLKRLASAFSAPKGIAVLTVAKTRHKASRSK